MGFIDYLVGVATRRRVPPTDVVGTGGTAVYSGYLQTGETDARVIGEQRYLTYREILTNCAIVAASVRFFQNLIGRARWKVDPADDSGEAKRIAEELEAMLYDLERPWSRVVRAASTHRLYGFSAHEIVAKRRDDGVIGIRDLKPRPQRTIERWDLDEESALRGIVQRSPQDFREVYLPRWKLFMPVDDSLTDSPEGLGILRQACEPFFRLKTLQRIELVGYETELAGIPIGRAPRGLLQQLVKAGTITKETAAAAEKPLIDLISNHIRGKTSGAVLDSQPFTSQGADATPSSIYQWSLELLKGGSGQGTFAGIGSAIDRCIRELALMLGTEGLLLGGNGAGSLAMSKDKSQNFGLNVEAALVEIGETVEIDIFGLMMKLNGWPRELTPTAKPDAVHMRDVEDIAATLERMARAGAAILPGDPAVDEVRDLLGLSHEPESDLSLIGRPDGNGNGAPGGETEDEDLSATEEDADASADESKGLTKYRDDQRRVARGSAGGGRFASENGGETSAALAAGGSWRKAKTSSGKGETRELVRDGKVVGRLVDAGKDAGDERFTGYVRGAQRTFSDFADARGWVYENATKPL